MAENLRGQARAPSVSQEPEASVESEARHAPVAHAMPPSEAELPEGRVWEALRLLMTVPAQ
eukprot:3655796-Alexandrium_andersonii.AAC.1